MNGGEGMINIKNKIDCCGCSACVSACPIDCITFEEDEEGFRYPLVNQSACINCNKCENVCPIKKTANKIASDGMLQSKESFTQEKINENQYPVLAYAAFNTDTDTRQDSTSGGVFSVLANYVISCGGVVYGVALDDKFQVAHTEVDLIDLIAKFRGSKYVQSYQADIFKQIRKRLNKNYMVLYSGTPCQIEGLKSFLGKEYSNLITVDIFCHGVGSPKYWNKYLQYMEKKYKSAIKEIRFREKTYGYNSACMAVYFKNGKNSHKDHDCDLYWTAFSKCYIFRPSCYSCRFKTVHHVSDFTIGDYWDTSKLGEVFKKANGCTLLLLHSKKAQEIMQEVKSHLYMTKLDLYAALIVNGGPMPSKLISSSPKPDKRDEFLNDMNKMELEKLICSYIPISVSKRIKLAIKPFLYKTKLLEAIKRG